MAAGTEIGAEGLGSVSMGSVTGLAVLSAAAGEVAELAFSADLAGLALCFALGDLCTDELNEAISSSASGAFFMLTLPSPDSIHKFSGTMT